MTTKGHCLCKKTTWEYAGEQTWACYCHCDACRRNCAAPVVAWLGVPLKNFQWTGDVPKTYASSPGVFRHFCNTCGTPMALEADHYEDGINLYAATLEEPSKFKPSFHLNYESQLPWFALHDDLTKYDGTLLEAPNDLSDYK